MTLTANSSGVIVGKFSTPAVNPASKKLTFTGGSGSVAEAVFFADGVFGEVKKNGRITTADVLSPPIIDANSAVPIFQVFQTPIDADISSVGLHFSAIGATFVSVQIREMDGDYPSRLFMRAAVVKSSLITANTWHDFVFDAPVLLLAGKKYALCVFCSDATTELSIANIGAALSSTETATNTSCVIGELYTSANGVDYQHQKNKVLAFKVKKPTYTEAVKTIDLGVVAVTNINRICVLSPSSPTLNGLSADRVLLTLPDSTIIHALDGQVISLATTVTGNIAISKRIYSNSNRSSVAVGGTQILVGRVGTSGDYISAPIISEVGGSLRVCVEANAPIGSDVAVFVSDADVVSWTPASLVGSPIDLGDGLSRFVFVSSALSTARSIYKIHLAGTVELVPVVYSSTVESGFFAAASDSLSAHLIDASAHGLDALRLRLIANGVDADLAATNVITSDIDTLGTTQRGWISVTTPNRPFDDCIFDVVSLTSTDAIQIAKNTGQEAYRYGFGGVDHAGHTWSDWTYRANRNGDSNQFFSVKTATSDNHAPTYKQLVDGLNAVAGAIPSISGKADLAGSSSQLFSAADGTSGKQVVNFDQLDTKAAKAGDNTQAFKVAAAANADEAIRMDQLTSMSGAIKTAILQMIYQVGQPYFNKTDARNPNTIFGVTVGTWAQEKGRFLVGFDDTQEEFDLLAATGGAKSHAMTLGNLIEHSHVVDGQWVAGNGSNLGAEAPGATTTTSGNTTGNTGSATPTPIPTLPPYVVYSWWVRTA